MIILLYLLTNFCLFFVFPNVAFFITNDLLPQELKEVGPEIASSCFNRISLMTDLKFSNLKEICQFFV